MVFGYLDPAAGGMIVQTIVAAAVAAPFILRAHIQRGFARLRGSRAKSAAKPASDN